MKAMTNNFSDSNELSNQIKTSKKKNKSYKKEKERKSKNNNDKSDIKMKEFIGNRFEKMIIHNISKKIFLEDLEVNNFSNINEIVFTNFFLDLKELKDDILFKLDPELDLNKTLNLTKIKIQNKFNINFANYFCNQEDYNKIFIPSSDIYTSSTNMEELDYEDYSKKKEKMKDRKINNKDLTEVESDFFMKNIKGSCLLIYLKEMINNYRAFEMIKGSDLNEKGLYNICFEINVQAKDVIKKKLLQLYKLVSFFNLIYKLNGFFKDNEYDHDEKSLISESKRYFLSKTKFFDFNSKLAIIVVCNGDPYYFFNLKKEIEELRKQENNSLKKLENINKRNYNIFIIYYPRFQDEKLFVDNIILRNKVDELQNKIKGLEAREKKHMIYKKKIISIKPTFFLKNKKSK